MDGFVGHEQTIQDLDQWFRSFHKQKKKTAILHGPHGIGKSMLIRKICAYYDVQLYEVDFESNDTFQRSLVNMRADQGMFNTRADQGMYKAQRIALMADDIDLVRKKTIREAMLKLMNTTTVPLFCTYSATKTAVYNAGATWFKMLPLPLDIMIEHLQHINTMENLDRSATIIRQVAKCSSGDMQYALISLRHCALITHKDHELVNIDTITYDLFNDSLPSFTKMETIYEKQGDCLLNTLQKCYLDRCTLEQAVIIADGFSEMTLFMRYQQSTRTRIMTPAILATTVYNIVTTRRKPKNLVQTNLYDYWI